MRFWSVFRKAVREQKRDLWVLGLSLAFAPLFVLLYWLFTGGNATTSYGVLAINQDTGYTFTDGSTLNAGDETFLDFGAQPNSETAAEDPIIPESSEEQSPLLAIIGVGLLVAAIALGAVAFFMRR